MGLQAVLGALGWQVDPIKAPTPDILSNNAPMVESQQPAAGAADKASRGDHQHPRLTSATVHTLNGSGEAPITFTRSFDVFPCMDFTYVEAADNPPVIFKVKSWTLDGSNKIIGCVAKGYRGQVVPQNLATLLLGAVFNVFGGSASGVQFTAIALQQST